MLNLFDLCLYFIVFTAEDVDAFKRAVVAGDDFISLESSEPEPVQEVFLLNVTPQSSREKLALQLLLDPATDISVIARHFGLGLVGSKFILAHYAIHTLKFTLFGSSPQFIYNEKLGLGSSRSDVDLGVVKSAEAGLKAVKQWADNHCSFAKHGIQGQMRLDSAQTLTKS